MAIKVLIFTSPKCQPCVRTKPAWKRILKNIAPFVKPFGIEITKLSIHDKMNEKMLAKRYVISVDEDADLTKSEKALYKKEGLFTVEAIPTIVKINTETKKEEFIVGGLAEDYKQKDENYFVWLVTSFILKDIIDQFISKEKVFLAINNKEA
jgi:glutaredoxin